jgi:hypothetical protein
MATQNLSTVPEIVNITHYGGDTLTIEVTPEAGLADGLDWNAQVRSSRTADPTSAVFVVTRPTAPGMPGYLVLPAAETARLCGTAPVVQVRLADGSLFSVAEFQGVYDCQVSNAGSDPVTTIVQGNLIIQIDVTRLP